MGELFFCGVRVFRMDLSGVGGEKSRVLTWAGEPGCWLEFSLSRPV